MLSPNCQTAPEAGPCPRGHNTTAGAAPPLAASAIASSFLPFRATINSPSGEPAAGGPTSRSTSSFRAVLARAFVNDAASTAAASLPTHTTRSEHFFTGCDVGVSSDLGSSPHAERTSPSAPTERAAAPLAIMNSRRVVLGHADPVHRRQTVSSRPFVVSCFAHVVSPSTVFLW